MCSSLALLYNLCIDFLLSFSLLSCCCCCCCFLVFNSIWLDSNWLGRISINYTLILYQFSYLLEIYFYKSLVIVNDNLTQQIRKFMNFDCKILVILESLLQLQFQLLTPFVSWNFKFIGVKIFQYIPFEYVNLSCYLFFLVDFVHICSFILFPNCKQF